MTSIVRPMYSNPAGHGVFILDRILRDPSMMAEWQRELRSMVDRVADMRRKLKERLEKLAPKHDWSPIATQGPHSIETISARVKMCKIIWVLYLHDIIKLERKPSGSMHERHFLFLFHSPPPAMQSCRIEAGIIIHH